MPQDGASWTTDDVERDDLALRTFALTDQGLVKSFSYPCKLTECPYWGDHGPPGVKLVIDAFRVEGDGCF